MMTLRQRGKKKVQWSLVNEKHCNSKWFTPHTKLSRVNRSNLQLVEPPLVYKPILLSMPILWVIKLYRDYLTQESIRASCYDLLFHPSLKVHCHGQNNFWCHCQEKALQNKGATWKINSCFRLKQLVFTHYID